MEKLGYLFLAIVAIIYFVAIMVGLIAAFPWGIIGFILLIGIGLLFIKVITDRLDNKEDNYYEKNIEQ